MLTLIRRVLAATVLIAAMAAPTAAYARFNESQAGATGVSVEPPYISGVAGEAAASHAPRHPPQAFSGAMRGSGRRACWC